MGLAVVISLPEKDFKKRRSTQTVISKHQPQEIQIWAGEYPNNNNNNTTWAGSG